MPVEDVQLHGGHAIEIALDHFDRLEVPSAIDHQAAPAKARRVLNLRRGKYVVGSRLLHKLDQSLRGRASLQPRLRLQVRAWQALL